MSETGLTARGQFDGQDSFLMAIGVLPPASEEGGKRSYGAHPGVLLAIQGLLAFLAASGQADVGHC
jgi:hypothetical protein